MDLHPAIIFLGGVVIVILGAELVLRGAVRIAAMLGVRPIVIGLTIVAVGTSTPELAVGITAVADGRGPLAVGNIAGTNILNILFILGLSAAIRPLPLHMRSIQVDVMVMIASAVALFTMAWNGTLSRLEGALLIFGAVAYLALIVRLSRSETPAVRREYVEEYGSRALGMRDGIAQGAWNAALLVVGIALSVLGADLLVAGAVSIAAAFGVSDAVIGLTVVAIGTSAPELATTVVATIKDDRDVAVGNLIGSSICNILVILGVTCVVAPDAVEVGRDVLWIDLPLAAAVALACMPVFRSDQVVSRREGAAFVAAYLVYMIVLVFVRA